MRFVRLTGSMVAVAFACGLSSGADAMPLAGKGHAVTPIVQLAAHKPNRWYWNGHWWRPGPWSDHVIVGMFPRQGHHMMFVPRGPERQGYCAGKYPSLPTGTYVTKNGNCCVC